MANITIIMQMISHNQKIRHAVHTDTHYQRNQCKIITINKKYISPAGIVWINLYTRRGLWELCEKSQPIVSIKNRHGLWKMIFGEVYSTHVWSCEPPSTEILQNIWPVTIIVVRISQFQAAAWQCLFESQAQGALCDLQRLSCLYIYDLCCGSMWR